MLNMIFKNETHRVERLLKRLGEVEKQCKSMPVAGAVVEKTSKGEQPPSTGEV